MADSDELSEKIDQLLYHQALFSLRQRFPDPDEKFMMEDIRKEQLRLKGEYANRYKDEPPLDFIPKSA